MNFPTLDALVRNSRSGFIGPLAQSAYEKRMEAVEIKRRFANAFTAAVIKMEPMAMPLVVKTTVEPYVSTPLKTYEIKEEAVTPTARDIQLWKVAAEIEDSEEVSQAVRALAIDDATKTLVAFLIEEEIIDYVPPAKKMCRALTF